MAKCGCKVIAYSRVTKKRVFEGPFTAFSMMEAEEAARKHLDGNTPDKVVQLQIRCDDGMLMYGKCEGTGLGPTSCDLDYAVPGSQDLSARLAGLKKRR